MDPTDPYVELPLESPPSVSGIATPEAAANESTNSSSPHSFMSEQEWGSSCTQSHLPSATPHTAKVPTYSEVSTQYARNVYSHMERICDFKILAQCLLRARADTKPLPSGGGAVAADVPWFVMMHRWAAEALDAAGDYRSLLLYCAATGAAPEWAQSVRTAVHTFALLLHELSTKIVYEVYTVHAMMMRGRRHCDGSYSSSTERLMVYAQNTAIKSGNVKSLPNPVMTETSAENDATVPPQAHSKAQDTKKYKIDEKENDNKEFVDVQELRATLLSCVHTWSAWFLPYTSFFVSSVYGPPRLLWNERDPGSCRAELAFHMYAIAKRENRLDEPKVARGALLPRAWMRETIAWLRGNCDTVPNAFDTFRLVTISPDGRHVIRADAPEADVVPEELFDLMWWYFAGGPKYIMRGLFHSREDIIAELSPPRATVSVAFDGLGRRLVQQCNVLHHATLIEVARRGLFSATASAAAKKKEAIRSKLVAWCAALCVDHGVALFLTRLDGVKLDEAVPLLPMNSIGEAVALGQAAAASTLRCQGNSLELRVQMEREISQETLSARGVCGLTNIGNSCYMNSGLQCLSNLASFRGELFALPLSEYTAAPITTEIVRLLHKMWSGCADVAETVRLKRALGCKAKRFENDDQQDTMEFIEVLLDCMHEEMNEVAVKSYRERVEEDKTIPIQELSNIFWVNFMENNRSFISKLFFHQSKTRLECLTCGEATVVFDNNLTLSSTVATPPRMCTVDVVLRAPPVLWSLWRLHPLLSVKVPLSEDNHVAVADVAREVTALLYLKGDETDLKNNSGNRSNSRESPPLKCTEEHIDVFYMDGKDSGAEIGSAAPAFDAHDNNDTGVGRTSCTDSCTPKEILGANASCGLCLNTNQEVLLDKGVHAGNCAHASNSPNEDDKQSLNEKIQNALDGHYVRIFADGDKVLHVHNRPLYAALVPTADDEKQPSVSVGSTNSECNEESIVHSGEANMSHAPQYAWYIIKFRGFGIHGDGLLCHVERLPNVRRERVTSHILERCRKICPCASRILYGRVNETSDRLRVLNMQRPDEGQEALQDYDNGDVVFYYGVDVDIVSNVQVVMECKNQITLSEKSLEYKHLNPIALHQTYTRDDYFLDTSSGESVTLDECLRCTFSSDTLTNEDALYCGKCKEFRNSKVDRSLFLLPKCLMISLKRFRVRLHEISKSNTTVTFPERLDMAPYMDSEAPSHQSTWYRLRGMVYHRGSLSFGHYTAVAYNDSAQRWVYYDDSHAMPIGEERTTPQGAYIMFYEREDTIDCEAFTQKSCGRSRL